MVSSHTQGVLIGNHSTVSTSITVTLVAPIYASSPLFGLIEPIAAGIQANVAAHGGRTPNHHACNSARSLTNEEKLLTITLEECVELLAKPKKYGRAATPPLAEFGPDPVSGKPMLLRDGKYGLYVTDGEYNATLQLGDEPEELTAERVAELLAEARLKGPPKKGRGRRKPGGKG